MDPIELAFETIADRYGLSAPEVRGLIEASTGSEVHRRRWLHLAILINKGICGQFDGNLNEGVLTELHTRLSSDALVRELL